MEGAKTKPALPYSHSYAFTSPLVVLQNFLKITCTCNILRTLKLLIVFKITCYVITSSGLAFCTILIVFWTVLRSPKRVYQIFVGIFLFNGFRLVVQQPRHHSRVVYPPFPLWSSWISTQCHLWGRILKSGIMSNVLRKMKNNLSGISRPDSLNKGKGNKFFHTNVDSFHHVPLM